MPRTARPLRLATLAEFLGCAFEGDGDATIHGFGSLLGARDDELVFLRDAGYAESLLNASASAVLAPEGVDVGDRSVLRSASPAHDFTRLIEEFAPVMRPAEGIAVGAHVAATAIVHASASIEAGAAIGPGCRVGARTIIAANATLTRDVVVGADCWIHTGAVLREETTVGDRVVLQPGVVLGGDGFGLVADSSGRPAAMAQRGRVVVEDDVEIGANTTVDRATFDETRIRRGAKIDNLVQIAHNCDIGENVLIVAQTGLAGGTIVGNGAIVMAQVGRTGHLRIGDRRVRRGPGGPASRCPRRRPRVRLSRRWKSGPGTGSTAALKKPSGAVAPGADALESAARRSSWRARRFRGRLRRAS